MEGKQLVMKSLLVYQASEKIGEFYWNNTANKRMNVESTAKSVAALAVGMAIDEGIMRLSDKPIDYFKEHLESGYNPLIEELTIEHMLKMACGHSRRLQIMPSAERDYIPDWIHHAMNLAVEEQPGTVFHYDNSGPYLISAMLSAKTGENLCDWLKPRLFNPLDIPNPQWFTCPRGYTAASGSLFLSPEEMGKIGQLYLNKGV
jgi:CubicO group peptidase (beta-lactamase class C family)